MNHQQTQPSFALFEDPGPAYLIAEIGINHNGDIDIARRLIDLAVVSGWDCVKFQKRCPEKCVPDHQKNVKRDTPWGPMTYLAYRKRVEFDLETLLSLRDYCGERIQMAVSVWDLPSIDDAVALDGPFIKVPSAHLTNLELLGAVAGTSLPILLSTGMSTLDEVDEATCFLEGKEATYSLMHCHSCYPSPPEELNLRAIQTLKRRYGRPVGYSGHEFGLATTVAAVALGARMIERHVTLDRTMWGTDQMASIEPHGMIKLARHIRSVESALGDGQKRLYDSEAPARRKLRGDFPIKERAAAEVVHTPVATIHAHTPR